MFLEPGRDHHQQGKVSKTAAADEADFIPGAVASNTKRLFVKWAQVTGILQRSKFSINQKASTPFISTAMLVCLPAILVHTKVSIKDNYHMDCHYILYRHSWSPDDETNWLWWSPDFSSSSKFSLILWNLSTYHHLGTPWGIHLLF